MFDGGRRPVPCRPLWVTGGEQARAQWDPLTICPMTEPCSILTPPTNRCRSPMLVPMFFVTLPTRRTIVVPPA